MFEQPDDPQSCHWYAYELGLSSHDPFEVVNVFPACAVPLITGAPVFTGGNVMRLVGTEAVVALAVLAAVVVVAVVVVVALPAAPLGGGVLAEAAGLTAAVIHEVAEVTPPAVAAVTRTSSFRPTRALATLYVLSVAPAMSEQPDGVHDCHR
jgi:hypothetical protein